MDPHAVQSRGGRGKRSLCWNVSMLMLQISNLGAFCWYEEIKTGEEWKGPWSIKGR